MKPLALVSVLAALALAPAAHAATVAVRPNAETGGKKLVFAAGPAEVNDLGVNLWESGFAFQDLGSPPMEPQAPCETYDVQYSPGTFARCPPQGIDKVDVRLGAENDYVFVGAMSRPRVPVVLAGGTGNDTMTGAELGDRVFGEAGADKLAGRTGSDVLVGGPGDDQIDAADEGGADRVYCGLGFDSVTADGADVVARDCDVVNGERRSVEEVFDTPEVPPLDELPPEIPTILLDVEINPLAEVLREGLVVSVGCSATCTITPELRVTDKLVRRLRLPGAVVARSSAVTTRRGKRVRMRFSKRVRKILKAQDSLLLLFRANAVDLDGNPFAAEMKLRLPEGPED